MVATKATFQGAQFENVSRNLEFFILTTVIDITDNAGDTSTATKLGQAQNLNKFLQTIMLRCNPIIMSIAKTTGAAVPTHDGTNSMFGSGWSGSDLTYWTMKFSTDYPKAYAGTAVTLATGQSQASANLVYHLSNDFKGIAINIGLDETGGGYTWSASNDYINTTESADAVNRNTFISKTDIL
tara:strand:+ start:528 stop:1076 length:549 start_codon:yes stop_codon:yes gene_type:complete